MTIDTELIASEELTDNNILTCIKDTIIDGIQDKYGFMFYSLYDPLVNKYLFDKLEIHKNFHILQVDNYEVIKTYYFYDDWESNFDIFDSLSFHELEFVAKEIDYKEFVKLS